MLFGKKRGSPAFGFCQIRASRELHAAQWSLLAKHAPLGPPALHNNPPHHPAPLTASSGFCGGKMCSFSQGPNLLGVGEVWSGVVRPWPRKTPGCAVRPVSSAFQLLGMQHTDHLCAWTHTGSETPALGVNPDDRGWSTEGRSPSLLLT